MVEAPALVTEHPEERQYCQDRDQNGRYFPEIFHDAKHTHTELFVPRARSSGISS
jgi:hypothetical protein